MILPQGSFPGATLKPATQHMSKLELTPEETELLTELLEQRSADLQRELGHTDLSGFKEILKHRRMVLEGLLAKLRQVLVAR